MFFSVKAMASVLAILGVAGSSLTGYILIRPADFFAPLDKATQFLSGVSLPTTVKVDLSNASESIRAVGDSLPESISVNLSSTAQSFKTEADSLPDCVSVSPFGCVFDLTATKAAPYNLSDSFNNVTVNTGLNESKAALYNLSDSFNNVTVSTNLAESRVALYNLSDSFNNISVSTGLESSRVALYNLSDSLSNIEVNTNLGGLEEQIHQTAPMVSQLKWDVLSLVSFLFAISVAVLLTGLGFIALIRNLEKTLGSRMNARQT